MSGLRSGSLFLWTTGLDRFHATQHYHYYTALVVGYYTTLVVGEPRFWWSEPHYTTTQRCMHHSLHHNLHNLHNVADIETRCNSDTVVYYCCVVLWCVLCCVVVWCGVVCCCVVLCSHSNTCMHVSSDVYMCLYVWSVHHTTRRICASCCVHIHIAIHMYTWLLLHPSFPVFYYTLHYTYIVTHYIVWCCGVVMLCSECVI